MPDRLIRRVNGPRGSFLLSTGGLALLHAISCLPPGTSRVALPFGLDLLNESVPLPVYAGVWLATFALAVGAAFRTRGGAVRAGMDIAAFAALAGMFTCWALTYLLGGLLSDQPSRQWVFAGVYAFVAGMVAAAGRMINPATGTVS